MSPVIGTEVTVVDEQVPVAAPTQTDTLFLIATVSRRDLEARYEFDTAAEAQTALAGETDVLGWIDTFFYEGGVRVIMSTLDAEGTLARALDRFQPEDGPGQLVAPDSVTTTAQDDLHEYGWINNRVYFADCADAAIDSALIAARRAITASLGDGRYGGVWADTMLVPGLASGTTREVPASIVAAALAARNDIDTSNPNLAAGGVQGECRYVIGIKAERTAAQREVLAREQINTFRTYLGRVRNYGWMTAADLTTLPHWWDFGGSRTIMAARAIEAGVAEENLFGQIDGEGNFLAGYEADLRVGLSALQRVGAIYGSADGPGYRVDVSAVVNPLRNLAQGNVTAAITVRTSPHARSLTVRIVRRSLEQEV